MTQTNSDLTFRKEYFAYTWQIVYKKNLVVKIKRTRKYNSYKGEITPAVENEPHEKPILHTDRTCHYR